jgi:DNA-damage-inducible protein D
VVGEGGNERGSEDLTPTEIDPLGFEQAAHVNGGTSWYAREYALFLGYSDYGAFKKGPIDRAIAASMRANIPIAENFEEIDTIIDGRVVREMKLSRFGCFLVAMNADSKKTQVARVQAYLAGLADTLGEYLKQPEQLDRIIVRGEISDGEKSLSSTAKAAGVTEYGLFQNAGYRGMYNVNMAALRTMKGIPVGRSPLDFMNSTELAANLFRITQTDAKIQNERITGQPRLELAATHVGREVRNTMIRLSGTRPEHIPAVGDINEVRSSLKQTHRSLKKIDRPRRLGPGANKAHE